MNQAFFVRAYFRRESRVILTQGFPHRGECRGAQASLREHADLDIGLDLDWAETPQNA
jgi:hypothetical protein